MDGSVQVLQDLTGLVVRPCATLRALWPGARCVTTGQEVKYGGVLSKAGADRIDWPAPSKNALFKLADRINTRADMSFSV